MTLKDRWLRLGNETKQLVLALIVVVPVAAVGTTLTLISHATSPTGSAEAETGTLASGATVVSDTNASGGQAVKFGSAQVGSQTCTNPSHTIPMSTSDAQTGVSIGNFYVTNDTWNAGSGASQTLYACDYNNWYATATIRDAGDHAVQTYPNVHQDFINWDTNAMPKISSYTTITSSYAETAPHVGIYEYAYDIWLNGVADAASTEVMVWNDNFNQAPGGSKVATFSEGGQTYNVYRSGTNGNWQYIAFDPTANTTSGTVNLMDFFNYLMTTKAWIPTTSTIGQIDYGVELCSTNNQPATFQVNNFSLTAN
jgi:hypothetical protein